MRNIRVCIFEDNTQLRDACSVLLTSAKDTDDSGYRAESNADVQAKSFFEIVNRQS